MRVVRPFCPPEGLRSDEPSDRLGRIVHFQHSPPVLHVSGDEHVTSRGCRRAAMSRAFRASGDLVVDLSGLGFADTTVMLDLAVVARRLRAAGRQMRLYGATPQVQRLIEAVGLHRLPSVVLVPASA